MRRVGYTNSLVAPITWSDSSVVGSTNLNTQLRNNFLAIDNRISPISQDIIHYTHPTTAVASTSSNGGVIVVHGPMTGVNFSNTASYSPNFAFSIDATFALSSITVSNVCVEAVLKIEDIESISSAAINYYRYKLFSSVPGTLPLSKEPPLGATNYINGSRLGNTDYAFWSGFVKADTFGNNPFLLSKSMYAVRPVLLVSVTNGAQSASASINYASIALRLRTNVDVSIYSSATTYNAPTFRYGARAV